MKRAIIIGAGPAGLSAAYQLLKTTDIKPIVLEASNEIGGISKTYNHHGNRMDIGGHRFFTKNEEVMNLWLEIMPLQSQKSKDDIELNRDIPLSNNGKDPEKDDDVMLIRNRVSRILYLHKFFSYPISLKFETFKNMGFKRTMKAGFGYVGSLIHKRKETNLENFYINRFGKPLYQMFFEKYTEKVWGRSPKEIDAGWGAQRVKGLSLLKTITNAITKPFKKGNKKVETSLIEQFYYPKKGPGQLYELMAEKIVELGGEIHFNQEINKVILENDEIKKVITKDNQEYVGDYYFSSMSLKDLAISIGEKDLGKEEYRIATGLSYRDFMTVGLLLDSLAVTNKTKIKTVNNIIPDTWIYVQEEEVKLGRIQIFNNWSPYMVQDYQNSIWIGLEYFVNENDEMWNSNDDDFISSAIDELLKIKFIKSKDDVKDSCVLRIKKAYPGYFDTYNEIEVLKEKLNKISNLYCIGRNGQHRYNNMDHSILTSIEAVNCIKNNLDKSIIWKVNTEKEYHESKKDDK
ncbi:MAG: NAD(P)/FAD-dependent oxidoreductase [Bacilli bacterium]